MNLTDTSDSHEVSDPFHVTGKRVLKGHDNETLLVHLLNQLLIHSQFNYERIIAHKKIIKKYPSRMSIPFTVPIAI